MAVSFQTLYRALMRALDDGGTYAVASATSGSVTATLLVNAASGTSTNAYDGRHIFISAPAAQSRQVSTGGYTPSTGTLAFSPIWTAPSAGAELDITGLFPIVASALEEGADYRTLINRALGKLITPRRVTLPITTLDTYSLAAFPWLDRPERLGPTLEPNIIPGRQPTDAGWRGIRFIRDGGTSVLMLRTPFLAASGVLTIEARAPASSWVNDVETDPAVGVVNVSDTVEVTVEDVLPQALVEAYSALMQRSPGRPSGNYAKPYADALAAARRGRFYDASLEREAPAATPAEAA